MLRDELRDVLNDQPLIASVQADDGTPLDHPPTLVRLAQASLDVGVRVLRLQGIENMLAVREAFPDTPIAGLIKVGPAADRVYITPGIRQVQALIDVGCDIVCLDGTRRPRPDAPLDVLIRMIHGAGRLAMADCDSVESACYAAECGADILSTTLAGYTVESANARPGPDIRLAAALAKRFPDQIVIAEGRYTERWQLQCALLAGASGVVVGGALNDPIKQTKSLMPHGKPKVRVGAVDMGGTWLRFGVFSAGWKMVHHERIRLPETHAERISWIAKHVQETGVTKLGIGAGGVIDPFNGFVSEAKGIIPDHVGHTLRDPQLEACVVALNDGLATAWGHACLPDNAGLRVASITLGTGVGCGFVANGRIWTDCTGNYPRINDLRIAEGKTLEDRLGGAALSEGTSNDELAVAAAETAIEAVRGMYFPDRIVLSGGVGLSPTMKGLLGQDVWASPFGEDAGLYGAAALALFPPDF